MQIVIPMSGVGRRFINAGYTDIKPLIPVDGKPIIEHVVNLFPGESNFLFICNQEHLDQTPLRGVLERIALQAEIVSIPPHKKGPVYAVAQVFDRVKDEDEVIVNYCDFSKGWDYAAFLKEMRARKADGGVTAYKGFHPHMLGKTNYAFMREENGWILEIQEKKPFTDHRMQEFASDGTYYFKSGGIVKKYFQVLLDQGPDLNGEYYVSLVYNYLCADGLKVAVHEIEHMLQWGEPADLEEYQRWSNYFTALTSQKLSSDDQEKNQMNLMPLAGRGKRFADEGYQYPKPLIDVDGLPMVVRAAKDLPQEQKNIFVCLAEHLDRYPLEASLKKYYPSADIIRLDQVTEGQACTCELGLKGEDLNRPLLIGACDNGLIYDNEKYQELMKDESVDCVAFSFRRHPSSRNNPQMYGWIKTDEQNNVTGVSVKVPISDDPFNDHAITGCFYFRKARHFIDALQRLYQKNERVNNEFYVDSCLNEIVRMGLRAKVFEVDHYICWGTPDDYRTYQYWKSFFQKCEWHPYKEEGVAV